MGTPADAAAFFEVVLGRDRVDGAVFDNGIGFDNGTCCAGRVCYRFALEPGTDAAG